ncbi:MAG: PQQ-binding-like beta-propeller repeat protein [Planctomycetaceae bacterium]|nr:PQQ-binding-like beta-propeller repeat protein [Planctomycetaceae bacterium]
MENQEDVEPQKVRRKRIRMPRVLIGVTLLLLLFYGVATIFRSALSDSVFQFDFALVHIIWGIGVVALSLAWVVWLVFSSRGGLFLSRVLPAMIVILAVGALVLYRPVFTGGMKISRWEPRFWNATTLTASADQRIEALAQATEKDFSQFLGAERNGQVNNLVAPLTTLDNIVPLFRQDIGKGWSGFAGRNGYAFTMEQRGNFECVSCYDLGDGGTLVWSHETPRRHDDPLGQAGPRATPTLDGDRIYAAGANGMLVCLDITSGDVLWEVDLADLLGISLAESEDSQGNRVQNEQSKMIWGRAASPLIVDDLLVIPGGGPLGEEQVSLLAFDKLTGQEKWRAGDVGTSYSSPVKFRIAGKDQIVVVNEASVTGHNPLTGDVLWSHPWPGNSDADANTSQPVLVGENQVLVSKGYGAGAELIEINADGDDFRVETLWKNPRVLKTKLTNAVFHQGYLYALSDGILECVDAETGKRVWKKGRYGHGQFLLVGDKLVVHSEDGSLHLIKATPDAYQELSEVDTIAGVCWNPICVFDKYILVRSDIEMACFQVDTGQ